MERRSGKRLYDSSHLVLDSLARHCNVTKRVLIAIEQHGVKNRKLSFAAQKLHKESLATMRKTYNTFVSKGLGMFTNEVGSYSKIEYGASRYAALFNSLEQATRPDSSSQRVQQQTLED
ncbi:MAG: hypothetical protein FWF23_04290 [Alphaproteobacteria bacterium]|nr:hypothetical protein [Alphaproteobacteria bacterium]MCL2505022.1 hypothetical protein [Alphaproteobacteria bacterium]